MFHTISRLNYVYFHKFIISFNFILYLHIPHIICLCIIILFLCSTCYAILIPCMAHLNGSGLQVTEEEKPSSMKVYV